MPSNFIDVLAPLPWSLNPRWFLMLVVVLPLALWVTLAWWHAWIDDPNRDRRLAARQLRRVSERMLRNKSPPRAYELHVWLMMAARTWGIKLAAPTSQDIAFSQHALAESAEHVAKWRELVTAAERAIFADRQSLPENWPQYAALAASTVVIPGRVRWLPNQRRDWWPTATTLFIVMLLIPIGLAQSISTRGNPTLSKSDPSSNSAPTPEIAADRIITRYWNSPAAHHVIALSRLEQQQLNTALAHAVTAFVQNPVDLHAVTLRGALAVNSTAASDIRYLLDAQGIDALPRQFSPPTWQRIALASALLAAAMLCTLIIMLYKSRSFARLSRWMRPATIVVVSMSAVALSVFAVAAMCWQAWGLLTQPSAAITLRASNLAPIPTDLLPEQETTRLGSGSILVVRRNFLDWRKVETADGITGWVRKDTLFPVFDPALVSGSSLSQRPLANPSGQHPRLRPVPRSPQG